jgi:hypothetical protein
MVLDGSGDRDRSPEECHGRTRGGRDDRDVVADHGLHPNDCPWDPFRGQAVSRDLTSGVDGRCAAPRAAQVREGRHFPGLPDECMRFEGARKALAHDRTRFVHIGRDARRIPRQDAKVRHPTVLPEEGPRCSPAVVTHSDDLARLIDAERFAAHVSGQGPEVHHQAVFPEEGVGEAGLGRADPDDLPSAVDPVRRTEGPSEVPEVRHGAVGPEERMGFGERVRKALADDGAGLVHIPRDAERVAGERPEGRHPAVLPKKGVKFRRGREAVAHDLRDVVEGDRDARRVAGQGPD